MFILTTIADTIRVPSHMLSRPTLVALHSEIDQKYPNNVLIDVGLVICRYGDCLRISHGSCVPGDGGSHHECSFRVVVFRPFVEEVCIGKIVKSTPEGVQVSLGFFQDIFIPAYWMLRPSHYDEKIGLWVWTPNYDEEDGEGENAEGESKGGANDKGENGANKKIVPKKETETVKDEDKDANGQGDQEDDQEKDATGEGGQEDEEDGDRFEMEIGAEIRFKVKSIQFTQVTNTAKGVQATTTTTAYSHSFPTKEQEETTLDKPLRKRSTSVDLTTVHDIPASMHIVASICEDGLGLTSWWKSADEEEEEESEGDEAEAED